MRVADLLEKRRRKLMQAWAAFLAAPPAAAGAKVVALAGRQPSRG